MSVVVCVSCGVEVPSGRFCAECGSPLAPAGVLPTERKIVSIFFVDLVGSTAFAESADPEDVQEVLQAYHELVRDELERYGGSVQKFVGDAVMAVFGAPVAHEDDPERAVRAALRVVDLVTEQGLSSRAAVHTGEAVVTVGARPERGEAMVAGDVVNTAARLQSAAPADGVVVGEVTWRSTRTVVEYEQLPAVTVKGKASPVPLWRAVGARSRFGVEADPRTDVVHVGREDELDLLRRVYGRAVRDRSVQLVTVSGEPGIGKSRLVAEFGAWVDTLPELVSWRQGRCLPYGQGLTFWALGEVVKAHIGLLDDDPPGKARLRLAEAVADAAVPAEDQAWMVERLAPLVGLKEQVETAGQEENFAAWRGFLEAIAAGDPFVLVVEDLHWADEPLLQFLEHLLGWGSDVPLLVLTTARPELFDRQPGWGSAGRSATRIALSPLSQTGSARLVADLAGAELPPAVADLVVDRCGGNPLYAAEFIRMLAERDLLRPDADLSGLPLPDSVQAVIAARLDGLGADRKALLADAAVVGRTFWAASLTAVGDRQPAAVAAALRELVATQLIRPVRSTSLRGQQEYAFWHALVRDVAYAQLPRSQRSQRHVAAAQWLTATVGERVGDVAGLLVNHYQQAHRLAAAAGQPTTTIEPALAEALLLAARHAPDITTVGHHLREALTRLPADSPTRLAATIDLADVLRLAAQEPEAIHLLEQAIDDAKRHGDRRAEGRALARFSAAIEDRDADRSGRAITAAVAVLEPLGDSPELAEALYGQAVEEYRRTGLIPAPVFSRVIQLAEKWSLAHLRVMALAVRGQGRLDEGNDSGLADIEEAMQAGMAVLKPSPQIASAVSMVYNNYGTSLWWWVGPSAAVAMLKAGQEWSSRRGLTLGQLDASQ